MPIKSKFGHFVPTVEAHTADYTIVAKDGGKLFTNRGASGAVVFTLPKTAASMAGWQCDFYTVAAQTLAVASNPADTLIVHADATADSITTAATIGQHIKVICDGTGFMVISDPSVATTATAVTAVVLAT